jgi:Ca2+-binding EF-hand superfamily protein
MTTSLLITAFFYKVQTALATLISAMLLAPSTSAQMPVQKDTFEKSAKTEYVSNPIDTLGDDVYVLNETELVGNKERGEKFNKWFWQMVGCANEDGSFDYDKLGNSPLYFKFPEKDYKQLATDIISTFDQNGDNKVNYGEYVEKSEQLVNQQAGKRLPISEMDEFRNDLFLPWFNGFDYDKNKDSYSVDELAATLYALDNISGTNKDGNGFIRGDRLLYELAYVLDKGRPDVAFQNSRVDYYVKNVIN